MLAIGLETPTNLQKGLLDFTANTNVLPSMIYNRLKNKARMSAQMSNVNVLVHINGASTQVPFQVVNNQADQQIDLSKPWIHKHQCMLNFADLRINLIIGANQFSLPMSEDINMSKPLPPLPSHQQPRPTKQTNAQKPSSVMHFAQPQRFSRQPQQHLWVLKATLKAQGFYNSNNQI